MIDSGTAWAILVTPLGIAAGVGWIRCSANYKWANDGWKRACILHQTWKLEAADRRKKVESERDAAFGMADHWNTEFQLASDRATDLEDRLRKIERQRSGATRKGNLTRSAKRKALQAATTAEVARTTAKVKLARAA